MTVLRSREVKSVVEPVSKNNSPNSKYIKQPRVSSIQPKTPCITRETQSVNASTPMTDRSRSGSVRRSLRLASKNCASDVNKKSELVSSVSSESSRKRKSVSSAIEEESKLGGGESDRSVGGVELESAVVEDSCDSGGEKGSGEMSKKGKLGLEGESEGGVELESAVIEDSLVSEMDGDEGSGEVSKKGKGKRKLGFRVGFESVGEGERGCLRLPFEKNVVCRGGLRGFVEKVGVLERGTRGDGEKGGGEYGGEENGGRSDLKLSCDGELEVGSSKVEAMLEGDEGLRAEAVTVDDEGKGRVSRKEKGKEKLIDVVVEPEAPEVEVSNSHDVAVKKDGSPDWKDYVRGNHATVDIYRAIMAKINLGSKRDMSKINDMAKINLGSKRDGVDVWDALISKCVEGMMKNLPKAEKVSLFQRGEGRTRDETVGPSDVGQIRLSRRGKGKEKLAEILAEWGFPGVEISDSGNVVMQDGMPQAPRVEISNSNNVAVPDDTQVQENDARDNVTRTRDRFRAQARRSASKFAFFSTREEEQNHAVDEAETDMEPREMNSEMEDWPGPFSTAMKIIKERGMNVNLQQKNLFSGKETLQVMWVPKQEKNRKRSNLSVPLLQELCMITLTKNADAITSLDYVPDVLRHKLSHMLCNMRRMDSHFLELLVRGSPVEIRIRDCSWLSEEDFTKIFSGADISNLAVLQLDQCGRCMPDYILYATLGRSPNCLPSLTTLSLKGACRLSDIGLSSILSSAPALRSLNLCQCSLLTSGGINSIADSLGSVLRELYVDDCESIDPILILPALSKLEYLEVLSLAGLHTVCDDFICRLIALRGHKLKELVLADCVNLTDISLKVISKSCAGICALDLSNLCKLTDSALGYLANGCQFIRSLKLRRNIFSDEAVAAYLETSGGSLEELSLNNVSKVAYNTAISLSKCSKNLQNLDMSFCRNLSNEAVGLITDSCLSLKTLKLFGCTQITDVFLDGHSNEQVQVIGLQMTPILEHIKVPELVGPLRYSAVPSL